MAINILNNMEGWYISMGQLDCKYQCNRLVKVREGPRISYNFNINQGESWANYIEMCN